MAKLYFRIGAMNSGKSTALLQVAFNYEERDMKVCLIKPSVDTKGDMKVVSRTGLARQVDLLVPEGYNLKEHFLALSDEDRPDCILVDEAQFLTRPQVDQLFWLTVIADIPVIAYGLRTDFLTNAFEGGARLLELAHAVEEIKTICRCGRKAIFNARRDKHGNWLAEGESLAIDNSDEISYESLCGRCYIEEVNDFTR
jgi:thymidine kinase